MNKKFLSWIGFSFLSWIGLLLSIFLIFGFFRARIKEMNLATKPIYFDSKNILCEDNGAVTGNKFRIKIYGVEYKCH